MGPGLCHRQSEWTVVIEVSVVGVGGEMEQGGRMAFMPEGTCSAYLTRVFMDPHLIVLFRYLIPRLNYLILKHFMTCKRRIVA